MGLFLFSSHFSSWFSLSLLGIKIWVKPKLAFLNNMKFSWPVQGVTIMTDSSRRFDCLSVCPIYLLAEGSQMCLFISLCFIWSNAREQPPWAWRCRSARKMLHAIEKLGVFHISRNRSFLGKAQKLASCRGGCLTSPAAGLRCAVISEARGALKLLRHSD